MRGFLLVLGEPTTAERIAFFVDNKLTKKDIPIFSETPDNEKIAKPDSDVGPNMRME